jgi:ADP-ribosylglycohydrolase
MSIQRIKGVIFGTAIGDAIGYQVEFQNVMPSKPVVDGMRETPCLYSDDTQMMRAVLEGLLRARTWNDVTKSGREVAEEFIAWLHDPENNRAPGNTCLTACRMLDSGASWMESGVADSKGCGSAMRAMAYGVWFHDEHAWKLAAMWAAAHGNMTHGHPAANASSAALAAAVQRLMRGLTPSQAYGAALEAADMFCKDTALMLGQVATLVQGTNKREPDEVLDQWRGWTGDEAVAAALYVFARHPEDFRAAILEAANSPGDSDSIACMVGALVGAHMGINAIPTEWVNGVEKTVELEALASRVQKATRENR